ncbi:dipeptidyl aminopeptidase/acylaminoacyl peptidase [Sinomonas atrocyanea]|uniref:S9 family peptidase n=1 Tax=Sinomonas atrocyanea TaxID=37927 RepID=UPI00277EE960|nr:S9 family peptidase [Sinomonas atrocyanea]MDP9884034.1 dipeptidyl aminopeptidase/acylaminoacyl peptidase [Sinomonas atrocyanea]
MLPAHLDLVRSLSAPAVHPAAGRCAVAVTRPDFRADAAVGQIWEVPLHSGPARLLTRGFRDTAPQYSPDGSVLAFLRAAPAGRPQLAIVDARGGEPRVLTDAPLGVAQFAFSPDGARIAYTARVPEPGRYGSTDGVAAGAEDPRLIRDLNYRMNGVGYTGDQRTRLFVLDVPALEAEPFVAARGRAAAEEAAAKGQAAAEEQGTPTGLPEARQLTDGSVDHAEPRFSADGAWVYTVSGFDPAAVDTLGSRAVRTPVAGGASEALDLGTPDAASVDLAAETPDGSGVFVLASSLGDSGADFVGRATHLFWHSPADRATVRLSAEGDDLGEAAGALQVTGDGRALVLARTRGTVQLVSFAPDGRREQLTSGPLVVTGAGEARGAVVLAAADADGPGELYRLADDGGLEKLTDVNAPLREAAPPRGAQEFTGTSADGSDVHGWVVLPEGEGPHPTLLMIHGGPFAQYTGAWFDEAQVYAGAGYAVVMCNPRGAAGYGEDHARAIRGRMGSVDLEDVLGFLDSALAASPQLDAARLGILGGSYGGYLTAWTIAHDHRFKAAIVERGFLDPVSFVGSSDIGWFFPGEYTGWDAAAMTAQSPMARVGDVRTPTLVVHSEEDWRCPIEQAQRYYAALRLGGVDAELLVFPGENHELSRAGTPHHRRARFEHILRWFAQYL